MPRLAAPPHPAAVTPMTTTPAYRPLAVLPAPVDITIIRTLIDAIADQYPDAVIRSDTLPVVGECFVIARRALVIPEAPDR